MIGSKMMRYLTLKLVLDGKGIHPVGDIIAARPDVQRDQLLHVNSLFSGGGVLLYRLRGNSNGLVEELDAHESVLAYDILDVQDDLFHIYIHVEAGEPAGTLMYVVEKYALIINTPLTYTDSNDILATVVGKQEMIQRAFRELPKQIDIRVEQTGEYAPDSDHLFSGLTDRQHEVLETAVKQGHYQSPRGATHADIAERLGCAPSTVDEHLRKAEYHLFSTLFGHQE
ncbi:helix-turn-helix domain-containing protein [Haladaptatus sp. AB643]|uniref:helix-turn-helix domain-containing protein n=1 Tax=unclassified Haladaptatus TaxID=2622732 RepID=UPI00209BFD31|nr:helix-turn-helix domain-containing protein [Haladaptatus sp. AB643]MCO8254710.1 helix-turn-helix domain-containing protein [Haladaptatus sp. AB618]